MEHSHTPEAIAHRLSLAPQTSYLRDWVYGGIDGAVTTFAVVSGVVGAALEPRVILILASPTWPATASRWPPATSWARAPSWPSASS